MGKLGIIPIKLVTFGLHKHTSLILVRRLRIRNVFYHRNLINMECSLRVSAGIQAMVRLYDFVVRRAWGSIYLKENRERNRKLNFSWKEKWCLHYGVNRSRLGLF